MSIPKEKRTKEETMRLLDRAIEQEETLLEKVKTLTAALADCRKKVENPRHELEEEALSTSKISFRLDYYRTKENGPLKGIIEHLSSRERRAFEGEWWSEVHEFVTQFVGTVAGESAVLPTRSSKKPVPAFPPEILENTGEHRKEARSPLLRKLFPELFGSKTVAPVPINPQIAEPLPVPARLDAAPFSVLAEGLEENRRTILKGRPFQIEIRMEGLSEFLGKPCNLSLSAISLQKKPNKTLETMEPCTPDQEMLRVPIRGLPFEQGIYRLKVSMTLRDEPQKSYYQGSRLLLVQ